MKSASPPPIQSPTRDSPLSTEARRQRDRKHLDDITAAKLPPLHHNPAQLLSLEESLTLQQEQTKKFQVLVLQSFVVSYFTVLTVCAVTLFSIILS